MWGKRATSAEGRTIRIAESSDMDSWEAIPWPMCKFCKVLKFENKMEMCGICNSTDGLVWGCWRMIDHDGLWSGSEEFCDLKVENVLCNYANGPAWGCWGWVTMKGYGRKRRSFGEINQMVIFRENVYKRDFLPFSTKMYFLEKVLKENSYKDRFMGKSSKSLLSFFNKGIEMFF